MGLDFFWADTEEADHSALCDDRRLVCPWTVPQGLETLPEALLVAGLGRN
jgi:hypothetical protein